jgi:hypothetical protein
MTMIRWHNKYEGRGRKSKVSFMAIEPSRAFTFSAKLVREAKMKEFKFVQLCYDKDTQRIGVKFSNAPRPEHSYKISGGRACQVSGQSFVKHFGVQELVGKKFKAAWDDKKGMVIVDLKEEVCDIVRKSI